MTFEDYLQRCLQEYNEHRLYIRMGQAYVNILSEIKPALMRSIISDYPSFDPYYNNDNLPRFLWHVYRCWDKEWTNKSVEDYKNDRSLVERTNQADSRRWLDG